MLRPDKSGLAMTRALVEILPLHFVQGFGSEQARNDRRGRAMTEKNIARNGAKGKIARHDKEERNARFIFAGCDTGANGVLNGVIGS